MALKPATTPSYVKSCHAAGKLTTKIKKGGGKKY